MSESLVKLEVDRWPELQEAFKSDWPRSVSGYYLLETQREWKYLGFDYGFTIYCPFGVVQNGMVAINEKKSMYEIVLLCPRDNTSKLEEALVNTSVVDWSKRVIVPFAPKNIVECLVRVLSRLEISFESTLPCEGFLYAKERQPFPYLVPEGCLIDKLNETHVEQVDCSWPHRYPTSAWYFSSIIRAGGGRGVFLNKDRSLISWLLVYETGALGNLYTTQEYRRKGLAEHLIAYVSNELLGKRKDVLVFCVKANFKAKALYIKMGFVRFDEVTWCYLRPKK